MGMIYIVWKVIVPGVRECSVVRAASPRDHHHHHLTFSQHTAAAAAVGGGYDPRGHVLSHPLQPLVALLRYVGMHFILKGEAKTKIPKDSSIQNKLEKF